MTEAVPDVLAPAKLGPVQLRNRVIKAATYEGRNRKSLVTDELIEFHREIAAGGVGMTTVAYCAVSPEGRTERKQLYWRDEALPGLRRLTDAVHAEGAAASTQIGHAGPVADAKSNRLPSIGPSRSFQPMSMTFNKAATVGDIARITADHANAARLAVEAGFDAVEIHFGHNYLVSSFFSPRINKRKDSYGGSLENRARFAREIARAVRDAVGDRIAVLAKLNMDDGVRGGLRLPEATQIARLLDADGSVDALEMTAGSSLKNPMYLFKGPAPIKDFAAAMPQPLRAGIRVFGRAVFHDYPYQDGYLLEDAKQVRAAVKLPMIYLGGVTNRAIMDKAMDAGFQFVAMGRALLMEPDLINRINADASVTSKCIHCNRCMPTIYSGSRCVLVQPQLPLGA
jgi:2,4-dienoyl-CoA reductase-like NADH-dependent reductase (Old Yellow Enzyme family)